MVCNEGLIRLCERCWLQSLIFSVWVIQQFGLGYIFLFQKKDLKMESVSNQSNQHWTCLRLKFSSCLPVNWRQFEIFERQARQMEPTNFWFQKNWWNYILANFTNGWVCSWFLSYLGYLISYASVTLFVSYLIITWQSFWVTRKQNRTFIYAR